MKNILELYKESFSGLSKNAWKIAIAMLINRSGTMVLFFLMLYFTKELGYSVEQAGFILSFYGFGAMGGAFLGGWLSDKIGPRFIQIFSLFAGGIGYLIFAFLTHTILITAALFVIAIISESFRPASSTAMANACKPQNRLRGMALLRLAINLGVAIGPAVGGFLALYNYQYIFWVEGATSIAAAIYLFFFYKEPSLQHTTSAKKGQKKSYPWNDKIFLNLIGIMVLIGLIFNQLFHTWPLFLKSIYSFSEDDIGLFVAFNALLVALIEMPLVHKISNKNEMHVIAIGTLLLSFGFMATLFNSAFIFILFTVIIWSVGEMLAFPFLVTFIANRADDSNRGFYMGMMTFTFALAFVIGPLFGAWVYQSINPTALWYAIGFIGLLTIPGFLLIERLIKKETHAKLN